MRKTERKVRIIFAGFSMARTEKLVGKMAGRLKMQSTSSIYLPEEYYGHDRTLCHSCFGYDTDGAITGEYFVGGTADMIYAASDADAVRNISWLKTEGTVIVPKNNHSEEQERYAGDEIRRFLEKQEEYGFVRTLIH